MLDQQYRWPVASISRFLAPLMQRLNASPLLYRLASGSFWSLLGTIGTRLFSLVTTVVVARLLGREDYGAYGMVQSTLGMFGLFAGFGLGSTVTKYLAELKERDPQRAGRILALNSSTAVINSGVIAIILALFAPWLAAATLNRPDLAPAIVTGCALLFVSTLTNVLSAAISGFEAFRALAWINLVQGVATPLLSIPLVMQFGIQGGIVALTLVSALGYVLSRRTLRRECRRYRIPRSRLSRGAWSEWRVLWRFSLPSFVAACAVVPVTWLTNATLANQPSGYAELGLFNAASQWRNVAVLVPYVLAAVMLPIFSETYGRDDKQDFMRAFAMNLKLTWTIALPLTVGVIALRQPLADLYGGQYQAAADIIAVLMTATFLNIVNNVIGTALAGAGRMWTGMLFNLAWAVVLIVATLLLVPAHGGLGLAWAYLIAYAMHTVWQMAYMELKLAPHALRGSAPAVLLSIAVLLPVCVLGRTALLPDALLFAAACYPLAALCVRSLRRAG